MMPRVNTVIHLRSAEGGEFDFVIDAAPEDVKAEFDRVTAGGGHGLMLVQDRRSAEPGRSHGINWQIWTSSLVGLDQTDRPPVGLPGDV